VPKQITIAEPYLQQLSKWNEPTNVAKQRILTRVADCEALRIIKLVVVPQLNVAGAAHR
jgi:hypothetical protein